MMHRARLDFSWWIGVAGLSIATVAAAADRPMLDGARISHLFQVSREGSGRVATWDWATHTVRIWKEDGTLTSQCTFNDQRLGHEPAGFAIRGDWALLTFNDPPAGDDKRQRGILVDLGRCEVVKEIRMNGVVVSVEPSNSGWLQVISKDLLRSDRYQLLEIDDDGKEVRDFSYEEPLRRLVRERKLDDLTGPMLGRLIAVGKDAWFLPHAAYELWRLPQHGLPLRRVSVPDCLAADGRRISGEENARLYDEMLKKESTEDLEVWRKGTPSDSFKFATTSAASFDRILAVSVRDPALGDFERLDLWDMATESLVAMVPLPKGTWLAALGSDHAWLIRGGRAFERLPLPDLTTPIDNVCKAHAALVDAAHARPEASAPATAPDER